MTATKLPSGTLTATASSFRAILTSPLASSPVGSLVFVYLRGRRFWTFRVSTDQWLESSGTLVVAWPTGLIPHLSGVAQLRLEVRRAPGEAVSHVAEGEAAFGENTAPLQLRDPVTLDDLVVNKWGRLAKSFESADQELQREVLLSARDLATLINEALGIEVFVTGGTLLGLVRDDKLISSDDDADLAYLSRHTNPSDVVLEGYEIERLLSSKGMPWVRHSSGHLQIMVAGTELHDGFHIDLFSYFVANDWFYGTFHAREKSEDVTILPLGGISHHGVELPIPANPEQLLQAIYGPDWRTPDPAFRFITPEPTARRYYWWLNHFDMFREDWEDFHRVRIATTEPESPSALATWLTEELPAPSTVLELGCGLGADALALGLAGHTVLAVDVSRPAVLHAAALASAEHAANDAGTSSRGKVRFEVANVNSIRDMARVTREVAELAGTGAPVTVVSRMLLDTIHYLGRDNFLHTLSHLLDRGGQAYVQVRNPKHHGNTRAPGEPVGETIFDPWEFTSRLAHYGLVVVRSNFVPEPGSAGSTLSYILGKVSP